MSSKQVHKLLTGVLVCLLICLLGGAYGANKLLGTQSNKLVALKSKNQALQQEQINLDLAKKDIKTYGELNKIAEAVVPQDKDQAEAVREIVNISAANGVVLSSITFPASTLGNLPTGGVPSASSGTASGTSGAASASGNTKANTLSQLTPVPSIPGVYQLPITIKSDTDHPVLYASFINFLSDMEHNRRTSQVQSIELQPSSNPDLVNFTLILNEYIKP